MSIPSFTDKKISLFIISLVLFTAVFNVPIKSIINNRILGGSLYFIFEMLLVILLIFRIIFYDRVRISKLDYPFIAYFFYGIFQIVWSIFNNNGLYQVIYDYRRYFFSVIFYLAVIQFLTFYPSLLPKLKKILFLVISLVVLELFFEYIYGNILKLDVNNIPWIGMINSIREGAGAAQWGISYRGISVFPYPHNAGLISAVGCLLFLYEYKLTKKNIFGLFSFACFVGIILAGARTFEISIIMAFMYLSYYDFKIRKIFFITSLISVVILTIFSELIYNIGFLYKFFQGIYAFLIHADLSYGINFFIVTEGPFLERMIYFIFGAGLGDILEITTKGFSYIGIYGMEWRIFQILYQYGIIQIIILGLVIINVFKQKNYDNSIIYYKAIMFQFFISLPHYLEMYTIGVFQVFIIIYAIFTTHIFYVENKIIPNKNY